MGDEERNAGGVVADASAAINAASLKLPTFWTKKPIFWFIRAEAEFDLRGITAQRTKFSHVLRALDDDAIDRVEVWRTYWWKTHFPPTPTTG